MKRLNPGVKKVSALLLASLLIVGGSSTASARPRTSIGISVTTGYSPSFSGHYYSGPSYCRPTPYYKPAPRYYSSPVYITEPPVIYSAPPVVYTAPPVYYGAPVSQPPAVYPQYSQQSSIPRALPASSPQMAQVQENLRQKGYYRGSVDGLTGPSTRAAIRAYQVDRGLQVTGRIDSELLEDLGL